jgi:hypothetical protein
MGVSSAEEDLTAAEAGKAVSSAEEDLTTAEVEMVVPSAEEDLSAAEAGVLSKDSLDFLFLRGGSWSPGTRGELSRLRYCSAGERLNICALGGRIFGGSFACLGFVAFGTHLVLRDVPGWPERSGSVELGTSRVVGKQGERGEGKLSTRQTRLETR